jgi:nitroimidazol reductase NimA-like FMN-containing flavoprotein (pyridoxamine 5'-phosphate oxidase superfamily)
MVISEMSTQECVALLARSTVFRLGCARDNRPYVLPVSLVHDEASASLYGFTTLGQKIEWMRNNPLVCVETDEIAAPDQWMSVVVNGRYEELPPSKPAEVSPGRMPERSEIKDAPLPLWPPDTPPLTAAPVGTGNEPRPAVLDVLARLPAWWQPGSAAWAARVHRDSNEPFASIFYRIRIENMTGHAATRLSGGEAVAGRPRRRGAG